MLEESPVDTMADQRTMAELLRAPTEGYAEEIVVPPILAEHFELKHSLINMMTLDQFFRLEKDNPHDHIWAARCWLEKEPPRSILTWEDLFDESFHEAYDRYKDLLRACPHHGFTELHQLDTFYNALNPVDQDSLNSAAGGNLLERRTQDVLTIIENKFKQTSGVTTAMTAILKQFQATPPSASVKAVKEICVTYGAAVNYNQGHFGYRLPSVANQIRPSVFAQPNVQNNQNRFSQPQGYNQGNNFNQDTSYQALIQQNQVVPFKLKNMMASFFQMNTASTSGSGPLPSNTISNPKEEDERVEETLMDLELAEYTIKVPPLLEKFLELENTPFNENCSAVILKKLPEKLRDPVKFLISCGFSEIKCKSLADLGASINLMALSVCKKLGLPELISTRMTLELANRAICTPTVITRDVFVLVGKFTFPANFVIIGYESDPRVPLILGRPFVRITYALIDVYGEEMILYDGDESLTLNMRHDTSSYSNQPHKESINMINIYNDSNEDYLEDLFATNHLSGNLTFSSHTNLTSPEVINPLSGSTTFSSPNHLLEEFADELALITFPPGNDDLPFDIESDLKEIEYLLNHDPTKEMDSILKDSVDECNLADPNNYLVNTILVLFTDEHTLNYSSPPLYDDVDDDLIELKSDNDDYDSVLYEDFSKVDVLPSTNNEDKVFNPSILIYENLFKVTVQVTPDKNVKKISISNAFLILKDFDPPLYELSFHKEVPWSKTLLSFSSENEKKVFNPEILTSKGVHTFLLLELSHRSLKAFKVIKIFESRMEIFPCSYGEDIRILDVPYLHFYPP
nr:hypothetical protein [Tanacetum cinerariifolium]